MELKFILEAVLFSAQKPLSPEKRTAFPAVSIVTATASDTVSFEPNSALRNRLTTKSA